MLIDNDLKRSSWFLQPNIALYGPRHKSRCSEGRVEVDAEDATLV